MGKVICGKQCGIGDHTNTQKEYDNQVSYNLLCHKLDQIINIGKNIENKVCYIVGMGAHPRSTYENLEKEDGVKVIWYESMLPKYLRVFSGVVASYAGIVKIIDPEVLKRTFLTLVDCSMVGIYFFDDTFEKDFVNAIERSLPSEVYNLIIKNDEGYFIYIVDADNFESSTGIYEVISYGKRATEFSTVF